MVVPTTVWCTSKERVQCKKDLRVSWHQSLCFPASLISNNAVGVFLNFYVLPHEFHRQICELLCIYARLCPWWPLRFTACDVCLALQTVLLSPLRLRRQCFGESAGVRMCRCVQWAGVPQGSVSGPALFPPRTYSLCDWQPDINRDISCYLLYPPKSYPPVFFFPPLSSPQLSLAPIPQFVVLNDLIGHQTLVKRRPLQMKIR